MKIKLSANSIVNLSKEIEEINLNHGYSVGNVDTIEKSNWTKKILGKLDKTISYVKPISEESNLVIKYIAKAAKFLSIQEETKEKHVEDLKIHINVDSAFNNFLKLAGKKAALMIYDFAPNTATKIYSNVEKLLNTESAYINILKKEIYMGTSFFQKPPSEVPSGMEELGYNIKKNIGLEDATNFIVFHEASHSFEVTNYKDYGFGEASDFFKNLKRMVYILNNPEILNELNKKIIEKNEIFGINEVDKIYISNVSSLMREIYADVGAILLQRNKDIYENNHTKEKDIKIVETIINAREKEQLGLIKLCSDNLYVNGFSHFTSSALMKVKEMYELNKIDKKILSQKEINNIVSNVLEQGLSRVLLANIKSNNENIGQLKILFSLMKINEINKDEFTTDINVLSFDDYKESIKFLKEAAGEEWVKKLNDVSDEVKENGMRSRSIWNGVFHKETYEIEKQESIENNKLLKEIDVNHSEKEIVRKIPISVSMQDISASIKKCKAEFSEKETIQKNTAFQKRIN